MRKKTGTVLGKGIRSFAQRSVIDHGTLIHGVEL